MVSFLLFWVGLGAFSFGIDECGDRLNYSIAVLLAEVVNIQWAFDTLPNIPYLSLIEKYIFFSFLWLFIISFYSMTVCYFELHIAGLDSQDFDAYASIIVFIASLIVQFWFYYSANTSRKQSIDESKQEKVIEEEDEIVNLPILYNINDIDSAAQRGNHRLESLVLSSRNYDS